MTVAPPSVTQSNCLNALRAFMLSVLPAGVEVIKGQVNKVAEPKADDFVVMFPLNPARLSTNVTTYDADNTGAGTRSDLVPMNVSIQCDFHGPNGADNAQTFLALYRSEVACDAFAASGFDIQPLTTGDPRQAPFVNGEGQVEDRWTLDVQLQANPVTVTSQDFATSLNVVVIAADVEFKP